MASSIGHETAHTTRLAHAVRTPRDAGVWRLAHAGRLALVVRLACIAAGAAIATVGCGAPKETAPPPVAAPTATTPVERYLPLIDKTVFAYETQLESTGEKGLLVMEIRRPGSDRAELSVAGNVSRVTIDENGIRHVTGGWLLKPPLTVGASFPGTFGTVKITALDRAVETAAGKFQDCLETVEEADGANFSKRTTTVYCPNVGIVTRRTEAESDEGADAESLRLRSHGPRVDITGF